MNASGDIKELIAAFCKAQAEIEAAKKTSTNPFFKSNYADLKAIWDVCKNALAKNNLCVVQPTMSLPPSGEITVETILLHTSGQWISSTLPVKPMKLDPQSIGSALSYARRYALSSLLCVITEAEDDDGELAMNRKVEMTIERKPAQKPLPSQADFPRANMNWPLERCTEEQRTKLFAMASSLEISEMKLREMVLMNTGKQSTKQLTKGEIQTMFSLLETLKQG